MKLAIAQIGADIDAPSSLIESGQYSVTALESLLKEWLHHAINQLKVDVSESNVLAGTEMLLDDISIELPDIDLNALNADPQGYFESVFSPVIRRILKHTIETQLRNKLDSDVNKVFDSNLSPNDIALQNLDARVIQYVKEAFIKCLVNDKAKFFKLMTSAEWPALRNLFVRALCADDKRIVTYIQAFTEQQHHTLVSKLINKLSVQNRFSFWLDFESIFLANQSSLPQLQARFMVLLNASFMFSGNNQNDRSLLSKVVEVLKQPKCELKLLKTWFALKSTSQLVDNDRQTLARIADRVLVAPSTLKQMQPIVISNASIKDLIEELSDIRQGQLQVDLPWGAEVENVSMPVYRHLKEGLKSSFRTLKKLHKLLNDRSEVSELAMFDRKQWLRFFTQVHALQDLPQPVYCLLQQLMKRVISSSVHTNKQLKKIEYLIKLVEREIRAVSDSPERLLNYVYANRIRALVCSIENAPSDMLKKLQSHCAAVRIMGTPLQKNVNLTAYIDLLNEISYWLVDKKHSITKNPSDFEFIDTFKTETVEQNAILTEPALTACVNEQSAMENTSSSLRLHPLVSMLELQGPVSKLVAHQLTTHFEQAQVAQCRLALCIFKQDLSEAEKANLEMQVLGANAQMLAMLVKKYSVLRGEKDHEDNGLAAKKVEALPHSKFEDEIQFSLNKLVDSILIAVDKAFVSIEQQNITLSIESDLKDEASRSFLSQYKEGPEKSEATSIVRLKQAQLQEVLSRLRNFISTTLSQIRGFDSQLNLEGLHQLVQELLVCCLHWRTLLAESGRLPVLSETIRTLDASLAKLQRIQNKINALNPYLESIAQQASTWWGGLLVANAQELARLNDMRREAESEYRVRVQTGVKTGQSPAKGIELNELRNPNELLVDLVRMQSSDSFERAQHELSEFITHLEGVLQEQEGVGSSSASEQAIITKGVSDKEHNSNANVLNAISEPSISGERDVKEHSGATSGVKKAAELQLIQTINADQNKLMGDTDDLKQGFNKQYYLSAQRLLTRSKALLNRLSIQTKKQNTRMQSAGFKQLKSQTAQALTSAKSAYQYSAQRLISEDAGIVLLWPFLETLFRKFNLLCEDKSEDKSEQIVFCDELSQIKAHQLLCYLVDTDPIEHETFTINALLGLPLEQSIEYEQSLNDVEIAELERLVEIVVTRWEALKGMPNKVFMEMFLCRSGEVNLTANGISIAVENKPQDILMMKLPWGLGIAQLPWLGNDLINIEWQYGV
ncbi:contractile injection system tape measure protein [Pseudoalteromonas luteoviolacea]|uniref:Uncharacterized protein n=1 Tax=Pseudoalteromonas luteoviolacea DSM 6061 TaxID=1365250 RepID=A0A166VBK6_9GAMM|nr:contractile injection system tape measure protein [Pseudoalteromonas luteoviolacea]KZN32456.1 hypothetical protein N475_22510 [Pseudoalteromonas luteoviolacea DSM 6061]MBE0386028.1 hypothetical protein [Pseudoalteromonas luteoviolacea DSM 6061]